MIPPTAPDSTANQTWSLTSTTRITTNAAAMNRTAAPMVPARRAFSGELADIRRTRAMPRMEQIRPMEASARGRNISAAWSPMLARTVALMVEAMAMVAIIEPQ